nr:L-2-hydroxyglutarate oxidase [Pedobacter panaciterrae]
MDAYNYDTIVIGAGLVGLSVAYNLKLKNPDRKILIIEKEKGVAIHQSGNNSGVIHSGIYYKPGSLKAQNCISGYHSLIEFAQKYNIPYDICGKIIVATDTSELIGLDNIYQRGIENRLEGIRKLSSSEIKDFEPHCAGIAGIHVPQTGIIDYPRMAEVLLELFKTQFNGDANFNEQVISIKKEGNAVRVETDQRSYISENLVSCAGLFSDRIASLTEQSNDLRIIPFRGEYYKLRPEKEGLIKNLVYPVPDPKFPFLGVHFTRMIGGGVEAGPNAVLAFKREGYKFKDFSLRDVSETFAWPGFWKIAAKYGKIGMGEIYRSLSKAAFTAALQKLLPEIIEDDLVPGGAGVRAQACDRSGNLIDDFNILESRNIIHVRNAPSPAATSCLSIGKLISEKI